MLIYRKGDRIPVEFKGDEGDVVKMFFSPLSNSDKSMLMSKVPHDQDPTMMMVFVREVIKKTFRGVQGVELCDGSQWKPEFDAQSGEILDESLDELLNSELSSGTIVVATQFLHGVPKQGKVLNPNTGKPIEGIEVKKS